MVSAVDYAVQLQIPDSADLLETIRQRILSICTPEQRVRMANHFFTYVGDEDEVSKNVRLHRNAFALSEMSRTLQELAERMRVLTGEIQNHSDEIELNLPADIRGLTGRDMERAVFGRNLSPLTDDESMMDQQDGRD